jgi:hypothetical protein
MPLADVRILLHPCLVNNGERLKTALRHMKSEATEIIGIEGHNDRCKIADAHFARLL